MLRPSMKAAIHPTYHANAKITCACGNVIQAGSTVPEVAIELCSNCHPFYTGKQNLVDTAGRVDRFKQKIAAAESRKKAAKSADDDELLENTETSASVVDAKPTAKKKAATKK